MAKAGMSLTETDSFLPSRKRLNDPLCRVVLVEPLIPENTGNVSRTCVGTESELHLVGPLGFEITESRVKRAGLDYWRHLALDVHENFESWADLVRGSHDPRRVFFIETWGETILHDAHFQRGDWLVFGKETTGLTREQVESLLGGPEHLSERVLRLPMPGEVRSLNLSNAVAASVFELLRQDSVAGRCSALKK
jgi:tRNA (cytidine/uridine-2'-O-)-methyltransferase